MPSRKFLEKRINLRHNDDVGMAMMIRKNLHKGMAREHFYLFLFVPFKAVKVECCCCCSGPSRGNMLLLLLLE